MRYLLHDVFSETLEKTPDRVALIDERLGGYTYRELDAIANQYAHLFDQLRPKRSADQPALIGVLSTVHVRSIAAILGTLKMGYAYVPFDENSPIERLRLILKTTVLQVLVVDAVLYNKFLPLFDEVTLKHIVVLGDLEEASHHKVIDFNTVQGMSISSYPVKKQVSDDLAYILHSSGSTGVPKGIMLTHRNARTFVDWMHTEFRMRSDDTVMSRAPFKFDLSVFDIFNTFKTGARLICFDWTRKREADQKHIDYVKLMEKYQATVLYTTPSTFICLMNRGNLAEAKLCLRQMMYAGEPFPVPQLIRLKELLPQTRMANIYGPTETNIITYYWIKEISPEQTAIPLGDVVDDTEILVVSDQNQVCEPNELGELWCRGGTVTLGYLGMPELTESRLVQSPFHPYPAKFWRTGDYGYRDETGMLHYRGRRDHMVKVKGYRIELGEVESALAKHPDLDEFCVVATPDEDYGNRLHAFYSVLSGKTVTLSELKLFVEEHLPSYMVPHQFSCVEFLPKNTAGKVDRILLREESESMQEEDAVL